MVIDSCPRVFILHMLLEKQQSMKHCFLQKILECDILFIIVELFCDSLILTVLFIVMLFCVLTDCDNVIHCDVMLCIR